MSASGLVLWEQQFSAIGQQLKEIGPQADLFGVNANYRELSVNLS